MSYSISLKAFLLKVYFRHINGVGEEEYLNVLDELENNVNALIIAGLQTKRIVEKVNQIAKKFLL